MALSVCVELSGMEEGGEKGEPKSEPSGPVGANESLVFVLFDFLKFVELAFSFAGHGPAETTAI